MNTTSPRSSIADRLVDRPATSRSSPPASSGTDTLSVACRLPTGAILSIYEWQDDTEPTPTGTRPVKRAVELEDKRIVLRGWAQPNAPAGTINPVGTAHGFGLTHGVSREVFERWMKDNANSPLVRNRIVFAASSPERASDEARELDGSVKSGFEPIVVGSPGEKIPDPRIGRERLMPLTADVRRS